MLRTAGKNSIYVRTLLVASCLGLLDDATFLAAGMVTKNTDDARPGSSFMKNTYRQACTAALAKWRDVATAQSMPTLDTAQALVDLSLSSGTTAAVSDATWPVSADYDLPADTAIVSGVESPGQADSDRPAETAAVSGVELRSQSVGQATGDVRFDGGASLLRHRPTATPDVSSVAEPFCHQLLTNLWRAVDLNENEQCGKRVQVFYAGHDNCW